MTEEEKLQINTEYFELFSQQSFDNELDAKGNLWLSLGILDISPNQEDLHEGIKSEMLNFKTGKIVSIAENQSEILTDLTKREKEVLRLVKEGFLFLMSVIRLNFKKLTGNYFLAMSSINKVQYRSSQILHGEVLKTSSTLLQY